MNADLTRYARDGYLLKKGLVEPARVEAFRARFAEYVHGRDLLPAMKLMTDVMIVKGAVEPSTPLHAINKMLNFEDDDVLSGYLTDVLAQVRVLIGEQVFSIVTNVFNKPPGIDGRHPLHQDLLYFRMRPAEAVVGVWTALTESTRERGCLAVVPGSHLGELRTHSAPEWDYVNSGFLGVEPSEDDHREYIEMQPGDTLLFHPLLVHGSGQNKSDDFRQAISAHFAAADCQSEGSDWREGRQVRRMD